MLAGFLAGLLCSVGGPKDSPHDDSKPPIFLRSTVEDIVGGVVSAALAPDFLLAFVVAGYWSGS